MTSSSLIDALTHWTPAAQLADDDLGRRRLLDIAAVVDPVTSRRSPLDQLAPLRHWCCFLRWPTGGDIARDGHRTDDPLQPPIPSRTRMFAGASVDVTAALVPGLPAVRRSEVVRTELKSGRSGEMCFVTVRSTVAQDGAVRRVDELDYVYRSGPSAAPVLDRSTLPSPTPTLAWHRWWTIDAPTLFRFSAITVNSHRIHYDQRYAREVEGYPDLVVHGPLLAELMTAAASDAHPGREVRHLSFRFRHPVFVDRAFLVEGTRSTDASPVTVAVRAGGDEIAASAEVVFG